MSNNSSSGTAEFSRIRSFLWPIHMHEMKKFLPLFLMFMLITFNYTFLRNSKDALVLEVGGKNGAQMLSALKLYGVLPAAVLYTGFYAYLCNTFSKQNVFYYAIAPFIIFFAIYGCILHPYRETFELSGLNAFAQANFSNFILARVSDKLNMLIYWPTSLYYIMSELWGSAVLSLLFWGFTNQITDIRQAKRFYALLGIGANVGLSITAPYVNFIEYYVPGDIIYSFMGTFMITTAIIVMLYSYINNSVLSDPSVLGSIQTKPKKKKAKLTISESFSLLFNSKHLLCIAVLVMSYGMSINLIEVVWKTQLRNYFTVDEVFNRVDYIAFTGKVSSMTGAVSIFIMLFVSGQVERSLGWGFAALVTPVAILLLGTLFFGITIGQEYGLQMGLELIGNPVYIAIMIGSAQNILCKAAKYSLFDPTKEKAYFPLNDDEKTKGKAAIDVVGARLGKAGGAAIQQILIMTIGGLSIPVIATLVFFIVGSWITSALSLSKIINEYEKSQGLSSESANPKVSTAAASKEQGVSPAAV